jgi:primosomal protein N' (replication factor Y)
VAALQLPFGAEVLGPVPGEQRPGDPLDVPTVRDVVRVPRHSGAALSAALGALQAQRSTRKLPHVRVEVDPAELG